MCIAVYIALVLKKVEQDEDEDCIDIEPTFDSSSEMIKVMIVYAFNVSRYISKEISPSIFLGNVLYLP